VDLVAVGLVSLGAGLSASGAMLLALRSG